MKSDMRAVEKRRFHGYGFEKPLQFLEDNLPMAHRVELFPEERIVFLDIPFGELYHKCTDLEWREFSDLLVAKNIRIRKKRWWRFW
jgi:hypothetical protein